jgi:hypothetical protein
MEERVMMFKFFRKIFSQKSNKIPPIINKVNYYPLINNYPLEPEYFINIYPIINDVQSEHCSLVPSDNYASENSCGCSNCSCD